MTFEFDEQIQVEPVAEGEYKADLAAGWVVGGGVNGGYLLAVIGNAVRCAVPAKPDPIAVSAYYLSASTPGPAQVTTRVVREGGSVATVAADLARTASGPDHRAGDVRRPRVAPRRRGDDSRRAADCRRRTSASRAAWRRRRFAAVAPLMDRFDMRFDPDVRSAGRSASRAGTAIMQAGSGSSTTASPTRSRC